MQNKFSPFKAVWHRLAQNRIAQNAGWIIGGRIVQMLLSLLVSLATARYLGPANYGLINYALAYTGFFTAVCNLGINAVLVKEFVDARVPAGTVLGTTLVLRLISGLLSVGTILCIAFAANRNEPITVAVAALCSLVLLFNIFESFHYWFQSRLQSKITAIAILAGYVTASAYRIVLMATNRSVCFFAVATSLDYIAMAIILLIFYFRFGGERLRWSRQYARRLLRKSTPFIFHAIFVACYGQADRLMLKHFYSETETGYYATAMAVCTVWCFVLSALIDSVAPSIISAHRAADRELFCKRNRQLYAVVFYLSMLIAAAFCISAKWIVWLLYGEAYLPAAAPLRILVWQVAFTYLGVARNSWIICENRQRECIVVYAAAAVLNVGLNFWLIPQFGVVGAAVTSLITQIAVTIILPLFIRPMRENVRLIAQAVLLRRLR